MNYIISDDLISEISTYRWHERDEAINREPMYEQQFEELQNKVLYLEDAIAELRDAITSCNIEGLI